MTTAIDYPKGDFLGRSGSIRGVTRRVTGLLAHFLACVEVARQRRQLLTLDDRALKDIGIGRAEATGEALRGFWDLPDHRKPGG